jgi:hypothetical protein
MCSRSPEESVTSSAGSRSAPGVEFINADGPVKVTAQSRRSPIRAPEIFLEGPVQRIAAAQHVCDRNLHRAGKMAHPIEVDGSTTPVNDLSPT